MLISHAVIHFFRIIHIPLFIQPELELFIIEQVACKDLIAVEELSFNEVILYGCTDLPGIISDPLVDSDRLSFC